MKQVIRKTDDPAGLGNKVMTDEVDLWRQVVTAQNSLRSAMFQFDQSCTDRHRFIAEQLSNPSDRLPALLYLLSHVHEATSRRMEETVHCHVFPTLVELASVSHSDLWLVQAVIKTNVATMGGAQH